MPNNLTDQNGAFARRRKLYAFIKAEQLGQEVLNELLPKGEPHLYEKSLWDYKLELPVLSVAGAANKVEKQNDDPKMAEIVKDAVSFYNSYGGYLVIGIKDRPREIVGFGKHFDCDELNRRIKAVTRHEVDCHFAILDYGVGSNKKKIGLLFVPQRSESKEPAQFLRDAPSTDHGKKAYRRNEIYFRQGDECRAAETSEDYSFLCSQGRRQIVAANDIGWTSVLDNNLGPRDPGFIKFIGREDYLHELWRWLCDRFTPGKLIAGLGGVGKTTIAREFTEDLIRNSPLGFERVIWLSAKQQFYAAVLNKFLPASRVDFTDVDSLLRALLLELGSTEEMVDPEWTREDLIDEVTQALCIIPSFVVIDDVDSLEPGQQQAVFHTVLQIMAQTIGNASVPSRALLTARLDLGAAPAQLIRLSGLQPKDFATYVEMTARHIGLPWSIGASSKLMKKFHHITDGSPTFAASILRLLQMGEKLDLALDRWRGSDGDEVRKFAFKKELGNLSESQVRTLYAACLLGDTSRVELQQITQSSETLLEDDIGELRKYHLLGLGNEIPRGGARLVVPSGIRLMGNLIKGRIRDPKRIERECAKARAGSPKLGADISRIIHRVVALWQDEEPGEALEVAIWGDQQNRDNPDLKCLLGRAYRRLDPPDASMADVNFRRAHELNCHRTELTGFWIEAKKMLGDWVGIVEVTRLADKKSPDADNIYLRAQAFSELGDIAKKAGNMQVAAENYLAGGKEINESFAKDQARGRVSELGDMRNLLFQNYAWLIDQLNPNPDDHIQVWLATVDAFKSHVRQPILVKVGIERLRSWWDAVERRGKYDSSSANLLRPQLNRLDAMVNFLTRRHPADIELIKTARNTRDYLCERLQVYDDAVRAEIIG